MQSNRRLYLMLLALTVFLAPIAVFNWIVDPYAAWGSRLFDVGLKQDPRARIATPYRLHTLQPDTLLVGTSRVEWGMPIEHGFHDGILNAGLPGETVEESIAIIDVALKNPRLKRIIWGADFVVFNEYYGGFQEPETNMPLRLRRDPRLMIRETLLSLDVLAESQALVARAWRGGGDVRAPATSAVPWPQEAIARTLAEYRANGVTVEYQKSLVPGLRHWGSGLTSYRLSNQHVEQFLLALTRARERGVEVTVYSSPMSEYELELVRQVGKWEAFHEWKRALAQIGPYWDFSGYSRLSAEDTFFRDPLHFQPAVGQWILRLLLDGPNGNADELVSIVTEAARHMDAATIDAELARQDQARIKRLQEPSKYRKTIAKLLTIERPLQAGQEPPSARPISAVAPRPPG